LRLFRRTYSVAFAFLRMHVSQAYLPPNMQPGSQHWRPLGAFQHTTHIHHITMLLATGSRRLAASTSHCTLCGSRLLSSSSLVRRSLSSQASSSSAGRHLPRWQISNRSQRAGFSSILQQTSASTSTSLLNSNSPIGWLRQGARSYATIIEVPTAAEDDLPEPLLQPGQGDAETTISVSPAAEKVS
jgi:hypothetical protein